MFDGRFRAEAERTLKPVGAQIKRTGIRADHLTLLGIAMAAAAAIAIGAGALRAVDGVHQVEIAGSARRLTDSVKDVDLIATADEPAKLAAALGDLDLIQSAGTPGDNAVKAVTHTGMKIDLQVVEPT